MQVGSKRRRMAAVLGCVCALGLAGGCTFVENALVDALTGTTDLDGAWLLQTVSNGQTVNSVVFVIDGGEIVEITSGSNTLVLDGTDQEVDGAEVAGTTARGTATLAQVGSDVTIVLTQVVDVPDEGETRIVSTIEGTATSDALIEGTIDQTITDPDGNETASDATAYLIRQ